MCVCVLVEVFLWCGFTECVSADCCNIGHGAFALRACIFFKQAIVRRGENAHDSWAQTDCAVA